MSDNINITDIKEVLDLISKLTDEQKKTVLDALRGAVLIAESNKNND
jgi:hypothetical protein